MKLGTANNILNRRLIWHLAKICNKDKCFRCGNKIASAEELSKDHIFDWLHSDDPVGLFFDPANVAFSHKKCNVRGRGKFGKLAYRKKGYISNPWQAQVSVKGKHIYLGSYPTEQEAKLVSHKYLAELK